MGENLPSGNGLAFKVNPEYTYLANYVHPYNKNQQDALFTFNLFQ